MRITRSIHFPSMRHVRISSCSFMLTCLCHAIMSVPTGGSDRVELSKEESQALSAPTKPTTLEQRPEGDKAPKDTTHCLDTDFNLQLIEIFVFSCFTGKHQTFSRQTRLL